MKLKAFVVAWLMAIAPVLSGFAQGYVDILPEEVKKPFYERQERISQELLTPANEWAGEYDRELGPTWSERFLWTPFNGFAAFRDTCSNGPRAWVNYGGVSFDYRLLVIVPEREKGAEFVLEFPSTQYSTVKWGEQHWLVPTNKLELFAYAINSRSGSEHEVAYLKIDDIEKPRPGLPELPSRYKRLINLPPIRAAAVEILSGGRGWYPRMVINAGKNRNVIEGMSFWLVGQKGINVEVEVVEVHDKTSTVQVISVGQTQDSDEEIVLETGWRFTSRIPKHYINN